MFLALRLDCPTQGVTDRSLCAVASELIEYGRLPSHLAPSEAAPPDGTPQPESEQDEPAAGAWGASWTVTATAAMEEEEGSVVGGDGGMDADLGDAKPMPERGKTKRGSVRVPCTLCPHKFNMAVDVAISYLPRHRRKWHKGEEWPETLRPYEAAYKTMQRRGLLRTTGRHRNAPAIAPAAAAAPAEPPPNAQLGAATGGMDATGGGMDAAAPVRTPVRLPSVASLLGPRPAAPTQDIPAFNDVAAPDWPTGDEEDATLMALAAPAGGTDAVAVVHPEVSLPVVCCPARSLIFVVLTLPQNDDPAVPITPLVPVQTAPPPSVAPGVTVAAVEEEPPTTVNSPAATAPQLAATAPSMLAQVAAPVPAAATTTPPSTLAAAATPAAPQGGVIRTIVRLPPVSPRSSEPWGEDAFMPLVNLDFAPHKFNLPPGAHLS